MKKGVLPRILISLLGLALMAWGVSSLALGMIGESAVATITSVRREGGERADAKPGRYTYSIGYSFTLPGGTEINGAAKRIGGSAYTKADGTGTVAARYFKAAPFINALEEDAKLSFRQPVLICAGIILIVLINRRAPPKKK